MFLGRAYNAMVAPPITITAPRGTGMSVTSVVGGTAGTRAGPCLPRSWSHATWGVAEPEFPNSGPDDRAARLIVEWAADL